MMKRTYITAFLLLTITFLFGQENYTGTYAYTNSSTAPKEAKDKTVIPGGRLVLIKIAGNQYRFWLDILCGPPAYNRGETDGTITFKNDTASFDNSYEEAQPCILKFKKTGKTIVIKSESSSFNCGFGNGVSADGEYSRQDLQEKMDNEWLSKQYPQATKLKINSSKTELYSDPDGLKSFPTKLWVSKGENILNIAETEKTVYTEFISKDGTLKWGWIKKTEIKVEK